MFLLSSTSVDARTGIGDVGVRFGGSEHHLLERTVRASSPRPPRRASRSRLPALVGIDCQVQLRPPSTVEWSSNDTKATGRSDAATAVDEGNSSKGVNRVAGKAPWSSAVLRDLRGSASAGNAANPGPAAGCNKPANQRAEQTVVVVRNHEGGTSDALGSAPPKGACSREWTHTGYVGGGETRISREEESPSGDSSDSWGHSEVETKATRAVNPRLRPRMAVDSGRPRGPAGNGKGRGGSGVGQPTRYRFDGSS
jgi:hypothetical protein